MGVPASTGSCGGGGTHLSLSTALQLQLSVCQTRLSSRIEISWLTSLAPQGHEERSCAQCCTWERSHWGQCDERAGEGILGRTGLKRARCVSKRLLLLDLLGLRVESTMFLLSREIWPHERHSANDTFAKWCVVFAHQPLSQLGLLGVYCMTAKCLNSEEENWRDFQGPWQNKAAAWWCSPHALCRVKAGTVLCSAPL